MTAPELAKAISGAMAMLRLADDQLRAGNVGAATYAAVVAKTALKPVRRPRAAVVSSAMEGVGSGHKG